MVRFNFNVEDAVGAGRGGDRLDTGGARTSDQGFTDLEFRCWHPILAGGGEERVPVRQVQRLSHPGQPQVHEEGVVVRDGGQDHAAGAGLDRRAGFHPHHLGPAMQAHLLQVEPDDGPVGAFDGLRPFHRAEEFEVDDVGQLLRIGHPQDGLPPGGGIDLGVLGGLKAKPTLVADSLPPLTLR